uniref:Pectinesterase n=1 Tax=Kalanchoe fedtschenkoi TaxID=63787 RepID=A0A7N0UZA8_KALFE
MGLHMHIPRLAFILSVAALALSTSVPGYTSAQIRAWCSRTPHPDACEYHLSHSPKPYQTPVNEKSDLASLSMRLALDRSLGAKTEAYALGAKCRTPKEKAAWADCCELYEDIVSKLNKTYAPTAPCSQVDKQTWLSTALTNFETCRNGFADFRLTRSSIFSSMSNNNVSLLVSNALALNRGSGNDTGPTADNGFPDWVRPGDRKLLTSGAATEVNLVVAKDGSGHYKTVAEAVAAASGNGRFVIHMKAGVYNENIQIKKANIMLLGDGIGSTIITGSRSVGGGSTTFNSATVAATGDNFIAKGITFRNTAGPGNHQAVALRSGSDLSAFYKCSFEGYQDTLYVHSNRQFYRECDVYGTVDFIFGNAAAVLQSCNIYPRKPPRKTNTLTAQGRTDPNQNTGISILNCRVTASSELRPVQGSVRTYLGRPWKRYSRTLFMKSELGSLISPAGWMPWSGSFALGTLYYGEYANTGPGASTGNRVNWGGYHKALSTSEASKFTVGNFIAGNSWLPGTDVPFSAGL